MLAFRVVAQTLVDLADSALALKTSLRAFLAAVCAEKAQEAVPNADRICGMT